ncbi:MAG: hypothetical protein ACLPYS_08440 [Vulcanimicrobiaceae bacterium]
MASSEQKNTCRYASGYQNGLTIPFTRIGCDAACWRVIVRVCSNLHFWVPRFFAVLLGSGAQATQGDGQHDFDFLMGTWKAHYKVIRHPLSGSHVLYEFNGKQVVRPLWGGKGNIEEGISQDRRGPRKR